MTLKEYLEPTGYPLAMAKDGQEAWEMLSSEPKKYFTVLLDREMPKMCGMEVLKKIKADSHLKNLPVIMQTARQHKDDITEGINAGAYYYLTKPYLAEDVRMISTSAIADYFKHESFAAVGLKGGIGLVGAEMSQYSFRTPNEADALSRTLAMRCPAPEKTAIGLWELMINAIEHGNLGISYQEKSELLENGTWEKELQARLAQPELAVKKATVSYENGAGVIRFRICDEGSGFDWKPYLTLSPERAFDTHGRGIALSKGKFFDHVEYLGKGNEVLAVVRSNPFERPAN
jgi:CheY-like chemotaxis protein